jgi:hypothetical protein
MTDLTNSQQAIRGATLVIGLRDGNQTIAPSDLTKYRRVFLTGANIAGRVVTAPAVAALVNFVGDENNAYPVTVRRGTTDIIINPAEIKTLETDGTADGLSDETGSPALAGFSDEMPLADAGSGNPGSSVYSARADHVHPADGQNWQTVTNADSPVGLVVGGHYDFDTSAGPITGILVGDPQKFDEIGIRNSAQSFASFALTVQRNGHTIMGLAEDMTFNTDGADTSLWFNGTTWQLPGAQL